MLLGAQDMGLSLLGLLSITDKLIDVILLKVSGAVREFFMVNLRKRELFLLLLMHYIKLIFVKNILILLF